MSQGRQNRVVPGSPSPGTSTRGTPDISAGDVPKASVTSSTRGPVKPPTQIQRKVTEKNLGGGVSKPAGNASQAEVAKFQEFHSKQVNKLVSDMRTHTSEMRAKLADASSLYEDITDHEKSLQTTMGESQSSQEQVSVFREEMEGDFELMKLKPAWDTAVGNFLSAALGQNKEVEVSTLALSVYLAECLEKGMPSVTPPSTAVVSYHPSNREMLKVFHADEAAELKMGANMRELRNNASSACAGKVWNVLRTGEPNLNNAHGIDRDKENQSLAPLKTTAGKTFGVVVTGPPPVPDEFLEMMCRQAGPLLEQVWKLERARIAIRNVVQFIKRYTIEQHILVYADFKEGAKVVRPERDDTWKWQPLVHNPNRPDLFELELKWRLGAPIGVVEVSCGNYTMMDAHLTVLLHVMGDVLMAAIDTIEELTPGDESPLSTVVSVLDEYERVRPEAPKIILRESHQMLQCFNAAGVFSEISSFEPKAVDDDMRGVLTGALCLMGVPRKKLTSWDVCKKEFRQVKKCHDAMLEVMKTDAVSGQVPIPAKEMAKRWTEFNLSIKGKSGKIILNKALYDRSPMSVQLLIRWVTVARMEHKIEDSIAAEMAPPPADPAADKIFDDIDADKDGFLDIKELTEYLLDKFPSSVAHKTLRILDSDQDKKVSRDEWRRGWADGLLGDFVQKEQAKAKEADGEGGEKKKKLKKKKSSKEANAPATE